MNQFIKIVIFIWLMLCALFVWVGVGIIGFMFAFTSNASYMYNVTPFIGFTAAICIIKCAMYVLLKSNPIAYFKEKVNKVGAWFK